MLWHVVSCWCQTLSECMRFSLLGIGLWSTDRRFQHAAPWDYESHDKCFLQDWIKKFTIWPWFDIWLWSATAGNERSRSARMRSLERNPQLIDTTTATITVTKRHQYDWLSYCTRYSELIVQGATAKTGQGLQVFHSYWGKTASILSPRCLNLVHTSGQENWTSPSSKPAINAYINACTTYSKTNTRDGSVAASLCRFYKSTNKTIMTFLSSSSWMCQYCQDGGDDELDVCYDGNAIVQITLQRDYLLLRLQDLVDSKTSNDANQAVQAIFNECHGKVKLQRFMVRAGTISILHDVLQRPSKQARPSTDMANRLIAQLQSSTIPEAGDTSKHSHWTTRQRK